jgi:cell division protein ZapA
MPEVTIEIGGRQFEVACQDGEEHYLRSAEKLLDAEASVLQEQIGRMPEPRMLLMSALMLADKTAALQEKHTGSEKLLAETRVELEQLKNAPAHEAKTVEVEIIPPQIGDSLADIAARAERLAQRLEET